MQFITYHHVKSSTKKIMVVYDPPLKDDAVAELLWLIDEAVLASIDETAFVIVVAS